ncbi:transposase domain-containing protein [Nonomuraea rubra]|uniref:transposase domain-containing protein n=1 Tax=Nonomuraea rubra TaxID=46180 RepID=UPI0033F01242
MEQVAIERTAGVAAGAFAPGYLGELIRIIPFEMVDAVLAQTRARERRVRLMPARVTVYLLLAARPCSPARAIGRCSTGCAPGWRAEPLSFPIGLHDEQHHGHTRQGHGHQTSPEQVLDPVPSRASPTILSPNGPQPMDAGPCRRMSACTR